MSAYTHYAYGRGDINIIAFNNIKWIEKHLSDVLYVPEIHLNLFSSSCALDKGLKLTSDNKKCELTKDGVVVAVGVRQKRLFKLMIHVEPPPSSKTSIDASVHSAVKQPISLQLWHERIGHQHIAQVKRFLNSMDISFEDDGSYACNDCIVGKQHRLPFPISASRSLEPAALVHTDVCGPMQEKSIGGSRYFILFKDDFSHYRTVYFAKEKSEVCQLIDNYILNVKTDIPQNVRVLRSDNGTEYVNKSVEAVLKRNSVRHERSVPYSPQQNGRAERDMRTIVESARTILHAKGLSLRFWAEAVACAVYVLNRSGPTGVDEKTPYELWFGKRPRVDHLRVFGSEVYTHIPKQLRRKWDKKATPGIFVGYCDATKGYRVWNPSTHKVDVSRDIVFKESMSRSSTFNVAENDVKQQTIQREISFDSIFNDDAVTPAENVKKDQSTSSTPTVIANTEQSSTVVSAPGIHTRSSTQCEAKQY